MPSAGVIAPRVGLIPSLDGLRALSILIVFWAHAGLPGDIRGGTGVTIFFFLSGFLITTLMRVEYDRFDRMSLRDFYLRRVFRILPPMYIAILVGILLTAVGVLVVPITFGGIAASSLFFVNYWKIIGGEGIPDGLGVLWSLAIEEHFYLVFPIVYVLMRKFLPRRLHQVILLAAVCAIVLIWRCYLWLNGASEVRLYYATDTRIDSILFGAILAIGLNPVYGEVRLPKRWMLPTAAAVAFVAFVLVSYGPFFLNLTLGYSVQGVALMAIFAYVILAPKSWIGSFLNWRPVAYIGVLSYTIYLVHAMFLFGAENILGLPPLIEVAVAAMVTMVFAWALHRLVERPLARLRKRLSRAGESTTLELPTPDPAPASLPTEPAAGR